MGKGTRFGIVAAVVMAVSLVASPAWPGHEAGHPTGGEQIEETVFEHVVVQDITLQVDVVVTGVDPGFTPTVTHPATQSEIEAEVASQLPPGTSFTVTIDVDFELVDTTFSFSSSVDITGSQDVVFVLPGDPTIYSLDDIALIDPSDAGSLTVLQGTVFFTTTETTTETQHIVETVTITIHILGTPATVDDCKNGGWMDLVDHNDRPFRNQGDCVSYVATGTRNLAAG